jgi:hypothetical protein
MVTTVTVLGKKYNNVNEGEYIEFQQTAIMIYFHILQVLATTDLN